MPTLREVQAAFARGIASRDPSAALPHLAESDAIPPADRLGIYRNTFIGTLIQGLRNTYPAVEKLVGTDFFEGASTIFIGQYPPKSAYLNDYGDAFGDFLAGFAPAASLPYLPHVARLEWTISSAINAPDAPVLDAAALASVGEDQQAQLRFSPHPSVQLVRSAYDADKIRQIEMRRDADPHASLTPDPAPFWIVVHRMGFEPVMRRLTDDEARFTEALLAGKPLVEALTSEGMETQVAMLAEHLASGRFSGYSLS